MRTRASPGTLRRVLTVAGALWLLGAGAASAGETTTSVIDTAGPSLGRLGPSSIKVGGDGLGLIAYYDTEWDSASSSNNTDLKVAHCLDGACGRATLSVVEAAGDFGTDVSLAIGADGLGLIGYASPTQGLKVAHCSDAGCTSATISVLDARGQAPNARAYAASIAIGGDGLGLISYVITGYSQGVKISGVWTAHCSDTNCAGATLSRIYETADYRDAQSTSITLGRDGRGLIAFAVDGSSVFPWGNPPVALLARCSDASCTTAPLLTQIASYAFRPMLAIGADGMPLISYQLHIKLPDYPIVTYAARILHCLDASCQSAETKAYDGVSAGPLAVGGDGLPLTVPFDSLLTVWHCQDPACSWAIHSPIDDRAAGGISITTGSDGFGLFSYVTSNQPSAPTLKVGHCGDALCSPPTPLPVTISDAHVVEGQSGTTDAVLTVTLAPARSSPVTLDYQTGGGTASQPQDYVRTSGTLTFEAGETTKTITVPVVGDTVPERDEYFQVVLSAPDRRPLLRGTGLVYIRNDDPGVSVTGGTAHEPDSGTTPLVFRVTLDPVTSVPVTVHYQTQDDTAIAGSDYLPAAGTLTFAPGEASKDVVVDVMGDTLSEPTETFRMALSQPSGAGIVGGVAVGTIVKDSAEPVPTFSIGNTSVREGQSGLRDLVFDVTLQPPSPYPAQVDFATSALTAQAGIDYFDVSGTLALPAGASRRITMPVRGDRVVEANETLLVHLSNPSFGTAAGSDAIGTIVDDDRRDTGDLDGDGHSDILWRSVGPGPFEGALFVWLMNGAAIAGAAPLATIGTDWVIQGVADFNGDGKADILWRNVNPSASDAGKLYLWMMDGPQVVGQGYTGQQADLGWQVQAVGDLDDDGNADIVWRRTGAGPDAGAMFLWRMDGTTVVGGTYLDSISADWQIQRVADFNGDGKADILWRNVGTGPDKDNLYLWLMDGGQVVAGTGYTNAQADAGWQVQAVGDLDGDGNADIVWRKVGPGLDTGALFVWLMDGRNVIGSSYLAAISTDWQILGTADFNGDGNADILWRDMNPSAPDAGKLYIWMMNGPTVVAGTGYTASQADFTWDVENPR